MDTQKIEQIIMPKEMDTLGAAKKFYFLRLWEKIKSILVSNQDIINLKYQNIPTEKIPKEISIKDIIEDCDAKD